MYTSLPAPVPTVNQGSGEGGFRSARRPQFRYHRHRYDQLWYARIPPSPPSPAEQTLTQLIDSRTVRSHQSGSHLHLVLGLRCAIAPRLFPDAHDLVQQTPRSDHLHTCLGVPDLSHDARRCYRV